MDKKIEVDRSKCECCCRQGCGVEIWSFLERAVGIIELLFGLDGSLHGCLELTLEISYIWPLHIGCDCPLDEVLIPLLLEEGV